MQKSTGQKRSIHERLEEKKQIVEQQPKKKKQRNGMELHIYLKNMSDKQNPG